MRSPWMTPRGSIEYTTVPLLVQIRLVLASIAVVPTGREIWRERAAMLIKEITSSHSHLSCCIHTTNGVSVGVVGRQSDRSGRQLKTAIVLVPRKLQG